MLRLSWALVIVLSTAAGANADRAPLIGNLNARTTIILDGTWNTVADPYESGLSSRFFENAKPKTKSDRIEYSFDRSPKLRVPGDWDTQRESLLFYEGPLWYPRHLTYQRRPGIRTFLYFGAANYQARVCLNGTKLGEHIGGFTPFDFEVTDQLSSGENSLVVEVDNTRRPDGIPGLRTGWWNYGGLTRPVELIEVPSTGHHERVRRGSRVWVARGCRDPLQRGVPSQFVSPPASDALPYFRAGRHVFLAPHGLSIFAQDLAGHSGLLQSQRTDLRSRQRKQAFDVLEDFYRREQQSVAKSAQ